MGGGGGCRCVRVDVSLVRVMVVWRSLSRLFMLILVGLVLTDCLVSCVLHFAYCVLRFEKVSKLSTYLFFAYLKLNVDCNIRFGIFQYVKFQWG